MHYNSLPVRRNRKICGVPLTSRSSRRAGFRLAYRVARTLVRDALGRRPHPPALLESAPASTDD
jgi:hypothetical protein